MIQVSSVNRHNTSLTQRETALQEFGDFAGLPGVLIQTCNRIEFYEGDDEVSEQIIRHLFRVVSGLESSLVGEIAIQGQVKAAYIDASLKYNLSKSLHILFQRALYVGKRVRNESAISRGAVSHSQAAVEVICKSGINLNNALITIIGAHKLNEDIIRFLQSKGAETIFMGNKSFDKAQAIADKFGCKAFRFDQLTEFLSFTDVLISATAAPHLIVEEKSFPKGKDMFILDLAFPRDIDENIGKLAGVQLYNLESIENLVGQNIDQRKAAIAIAEQIIEEEVAKFICKQFKYVAPK